MAGGGNRFWVLLRALRPLLVLVLADSLCLTMMLLLAAFWFPWDARWCARAGCVFALL